MMIHTHRVPGMFGSVLSDCYSIDELDWYRHDSSERNWVRCTQVHPDEHCEVVHIPHLEDNLREFLRERMEKQAAVEAEPDDDDDDVDKDDGFGHPGIGSAMHEAVGSSFSPARQDVYHVDTTGDVLIILTREGMRVEYRSGKGNEVEAVTPEARMILERSLPALLERFLMKNRKYAQAQDNDLGIKGIVPDINRKASVIINRLWHGGQEVDESTEEVIEDLIGHLLLMLGKIHLDDTEGGER